MLEAARQDRTRPLDGRRCRGVALLLAMIAVLAAGIVGYSYVGTQGTSLGIARNVRDRAGARCVAGSGLDLAIAYIKATGNWRTAKSNGVWVSDQPLASGTVTIRCDDGADANGDGVIGAGEGDGSLSDDPADLFTLTATGRVNGVTCVTRAVVTPSPADVPMIVYGDYGDNRPQYRTWTGSNWSDELYSESIGAEPRWVQAAKCPIRRETAVCILDSSLDINLEFYTPNGWSTASELTNNTEQNSERPLDLAYEQLSGDLLIAYRSSSGGDLRYRTYNGSAVSAESHYSPPALWKPKWIRLVPKAGSDEILALSLDEYRNVCAAIWNGSSFSGGIQLEDDAESPGDEGVAGAYETLSNDAMVVWSSEWASCFHYRTRVGGTWSAEADGPALGWREPRWLRLVSDPASNTIIAGALDGNRSLYLAVWNGSSWGTPLLAEWSTSSSDSRQFDIAFEKGSSRAIAVWGRWWDHHAYYTVWNGSSWSAVQTGPDLSNTVKFVQLTPGPGPGQVHAAILNSDAYGTLQALLWNGSSLSLLNTLETHVAGSNTQEAFNVSGSVFGQGVSNEAYVVDRRD